jgi:hypothetical protein
MTTTMIAVASAATAATCTVPSAGFPDIASAVADPSCTEIVVAAGSFSGALNIARTLSLTGAGSDATFVEGGIEVSAGEVALQGFHLTGADAALDVHSGAEVATADVVVIAGAFEPSLIFADGFESGDTRGWSTSLP